MDIYQTAITVMAAAILAETTYLVTRAPRHAQSRRQTRSVLLDTSVLIDGRILAVAKTGFIGGTLIIPRSVLGELQLLADTGDHDKRSRARFGLDVVAELQALADSNTQILQDGNRAEEGVDERLLMLAKKYGSALCTIDYNLNKVAIVEGIPVLNINELAQNLRMAYLPGERMQLELVQKGQDAHQAVGYLPDGTMVVVEHASKLIGKSVDVEIIRSLQTAAGRMMFAKRVEENSIQIKPDKPATENRQREKTDKRVDHRSQQAVQSARHDTSVSSRSKKQNQAKPRTSGTRSRRGAFDAETDLINLIENS